MRRVKYFTILLPVLILSLISPGPVLAETITFSTVQDTYANAAYPNKTNGGFGSVTLSNKYTDRLGFVQFENLSLPSGATLDSAAFKFYAHEVHYAENAKLNIGPVTSAWTEGSLTWNNKPTIDQSQAIEANISLVAGSKEISITSLVRQWLDGTLANNGLFIYPFGFLYGTAESEFALSFKSREAGSQAPELMVEYHFAPSPTPEPTVTPKPTPTPEPVMVEEADEKEIAEPVVAGEATEEATEPSPEETMPSPEATTEAEKGRIGTREILTGFLLVLAAAGAGVFFTLLVLKGKRQNKKPKEPKPEEAAEE